MIRFYQRLFYVLFLLSINCSLQAQSNKKFSESKMLVNIDTNKLYGTLTLPLGNKPCAVILWIAGSGPTDRDGNQKGMQSNAYKQVAEALAMKGIATLRYDKRGVGESVFNMNESDLRFTQFIDDALAWMRVLKKDKRFSKLIVAGHSEGSLIGMAACAKEKADAFISIAGAGRSIDEILKKQLKAAVPDSSYYSKCCLYLDTLKRGQLLTNSDPALASLFRESIQSYMISWIEYNPTQIISSLTIPIFIVQGETDIQVAVENAYQLAEANKNAEIKIIKGMNHPLKLAEMDRTKNLATYSDPELPVVPDLLEALHEFILGIQ